MKDAERERGRGTGRGRSRLPVREPDAELDPRTQNPRIMTRAKRCSTTEPPRCPGFYHFNGVCVRLTSEGCQGVGTPYCVSLSACSPEA